MIAYLFIQFLIVLKDYESIINSLLHDFMLVNKLLEMMTNIF